MSQQNYRCDITVNVSAEDAFGAITNHISKWWGKNFEGNSRIPGDIFTVHFGKTFGTFKITEVVPDKKIVWLTIDCYLEVFKDKQQWKSTTIVWEISSNINSTHVTMTHVGLVPGIECYEDCEKGWDFYIKESLFKFLTEGKGLPGIGIRATISNLDRKYEGILFSKGDPLPDLPDGYLLIDVKEVIGEHVISAYAVNKLDKENFIAQNIRGEYYMIVENKPLFEKIHPCDDLKEIIIQ